MIPLRDTAPCNITPYVTRAIMLICIVVFVWMQFLPPAWQRYLIYMYGMVPMRYTNPQWALAFGLPPDGHLSFLTSLFLHAGWWHLIANMLFLWIFADNIESAMGHVRFLLFYILTGLVATYVQWWYDPKMIYPVVGASGAIAGVLGAYFFLFPYARVIIMIPILFFPLLFEIPAIAFLGFWVIIQLQKATTAAMFSGTVVHEALWAHLGGFLAGALLHPLFLDRNRIDRAGPGIEPDDDDIEP